MWKLQRRGQENEHDRTDAAGVVVAGMPWNDDDVVGMMFTAMIDAALQEREG